MFGNIFHYILQGKTYPTCIPFKPRAFPTSQRHNSNFRSHQPRSNRRWTFMKTPRSIMHPSTTMELAYNILELAVRRRRRMKAIWNRWKIELKEYKTTFVSQVMEQSTMQNRTAAPADQTFMATVGLEDGRRPLIYFFITPSCSI